MRKWIFVLGLCSAVSAPLTQAASPVSIPPLSLETASLQVAPLPLPDEQSYALSFLEASQLRGRVLPFIVGVATLDLALAGFYWGVYVPHYAEPSPPTNCLNGKAQQWRD